jgi:hypothetical protein
MDDSNSNEETADLPIRRDVERRDDGGTVVRETDPSTEKIVVRCYPGRVI